jgi:hypothetical protein
MWVLSFFLDMFRLVLNGALTIYLYAVWGHGDHWRIERTLEKFSRPQTLSRFARKASNPKASLVALQRLTDQIELARVARTAKTWPARKQAIEKLDPHYYQSLLETIAAHDDHPDVRQAACEKLTEFRNPRE